MSHLGPILDKAGAAKIRNDRTLAVASAAELAEKENSLSQQQTDALLPHLETIESLTPPQISDYPALDGALDAAEGILNI